MTIGAALPRLEDARLLTGKGRYSDDFTMEGQARAFVLRSPHAHARIVSIDTGPALSLPGVLLVLTGADVQAEGLKPIPHDPVPKTKYDMKLTGPGGTPIFIGPPPGTPSRPPSPG